MSASAGMQLKLGERFAVAAALSLALHGTVLFAIHARSAGPEYPGAAPIAARLEYVPSREEPKLPAVSTESVESSVAEEQPAAPEERTAPAVAPVARADHSGSPEPMVPMESESALEVPVIRDPTYYAVRLLDEFPKPLQPVEPRYPPQAARQGVTGEVTLLLLIDENGVVNELSVVNASPPAVFDDAAARAFRDVRFSPGRKAGRAVRSRVLITVGFDAANSAFQ